VTNADNNRVQMLTSAGGAYVGEWGTLGGGSGQLHSPASIAFGPNGSVYVADLYNNRIQVFAPSATSTKTESRGHLKALHR